MMRFSASAIATVCVNDNNGSRRLGTAFCFIKGNWFVTAKHVVWDGVTENLRDNLTVVTAETAPHLRGHHSIKSIILHDVYDLAIICCDSTVSQKPMFPAHHDFVIKVGFIRLAYAPSSSNEFRTVFDASHISDYETEIRERSFGDEIVISFSDPGAEGGNSGAPLCGEGGGVVGVIIERWHEQDGGQYFAKATSIHSLLEWLHLRPSEAEL